MRALLRNLWRWSPLFMLAWLLLFGLWATRVHTSFAGLALRYGPAPELRDLHGTGIYEYQRLRQAFRILLTRPDDAPQGLIPQVHLRISTQNETQLNERLPASGRQYREGTLRYPDAVQKPVHLRYRGDFGWHWAGAKKSWRVRTAPDDLWNGLRRFNLITPKGWGVLEDHLGYWLAREMGLLAPATELVEVFVNGKNRGIHTLVGQPDAHMLIGLERPPGPILSGDFIGPDANIGVSNAAFQIPGMWEQKGDDLPNRKTARSALTRVCALLAEPVSAANTAELHEHLDVQAMGRFAAYRILTQSRHFDRQHNWRLYFDPERGLLEPIVWDPMPWYKNWMPVPGKLPYWEPMYCELDERLQQDPLYRQATAEAVREFFVSGLEVRLLERFDALSADMRAPLARDPALNFKLHHVSAQEIERNHGIIRRALVQVFGDLREHFAHPEEVPAATGKK